MVYTLVELPAGIALFKVSGENSDKFSLKAFHQFKSTADALVVATQLVNGELAKPVKKFLKKEFVDKEIADELAVLDAKFGRAIKEALGIPCIHGDEVLTMTRNIKSNIDQLLTDITTEQLNQTALGLAHTLNRYKLKFSPEKIDMMVVQAVALLEDLDKEINKYAMRAKEWYGWHFPELAKILPDNITYAKVVLAMQTRFNARDTDFSDFMDEELVAKVKEAAMVSMGTEISEIDIESITKLCSEVVQGSAYREQLASYLASRMRTIAPNLTTMVGETLGAKLIQKAGSLLTLAKYPASTVQILGAEKALFRALKKKKGKTPKYGLIFHSTYIQRAAKEHRGKISRYLANKAALASRIDCFMETPPPVFGEKLKEQVEGRLSFFDTGKKPQSNRAAMAEALEQYNYVLEKRKRKAAKKAAKGEGVSEDAAVPAPVSGKKKNTL